MDLEDIQEAAHDGHAAHQVYLARLHLMGGGVPRDVPLAMDWLMQAIAQGDASAYAERAAIHAQGYVGDINHKAAWADLQRAAQLGDLSAIRQVGQLCCIFSGPGPGEALLGVAAKRGDEPAQILLADALWARGDKAGAAFWYARSNDNPLSGWRMRTRALEPPQGPSPETKALPADIWETVASIDPYQSMAAQKQSLSQNPEIYTLRGAISPLLCRYVMAVGAGLIRTSDVVDTKTGKAKVDPYRTGFQHQFMSGICDFTVSLFDHHIAAHTQTPVKHGEPLTMLVYRPGQQYKPHWDHLVDTMDEAFGRLGRSGNRLYTALVTLDDQFEGGATRFTRLDIDVRLDPGDMLVFRNLDEKGARADDAMHAGLPVESGVKWLASKWIRERDFAH